MLISNFIYNPKFSNEPTEFEELVDYDAVFSQYVLNTIDSVR